MSTGVTGIGWVGAAVGSATFVCAVAMAGAGVGVGVGTGVAMSPDSLFVSLSVDVEFALAAAVARRAAAAAADAAVEGKRPAEETVEDSFEDALTVVRVFTGVSALSPVIADRDDALPGGPTMGRVRSGTFCFAATVDAPLVVAVCCEEEVAAGAILRREVAEDGVDAAAVALATDGAMDTRFLTALTAALVFVAGVVCDFSSCAADFGVASRASVVAVFGFDAAAVDGRRSATGAMPTIDLRLDTADADAATGVGVVGVGAESTL